MSEYPLFPEVKATSAKEKEKEKQLLSGFFKVYSLFESMSHYTKDQVVQIQVTVEGAAEDLEERFLNNWQELKILFSRFFHSKQLQDIFKQHLGQEVRSLAEVESLRQTLLEPFFEIYFEKYRQSKPQTNDWQSRGGDKELSSEEQEAISLSTANPDWEKTIQKLAYLPGEHQKDLVDYLKSPNPDSKLALKLLKFGNPSLAVKKPSRSSNLELNYDKSDISALEGLLLKVQGIIKQVKEIHLQGSEPETLSPEYLEALSEIFKGETLDEITLPTPEELTDEYFAKMYPETQREEDKARGLVSYRPGWWNDKADASTVGPVEETWCAAFTRSMKSEAAQLQGSLLLTESIQKPNYTDGSQQYGTKEGVDTTKDPLLPIIREVFGKEANRFNLSWNQINNNLLPKIKEKITAIFTTKGLPIPNFEVILTPALASNIQTTLNHPENSQTSTVEWSSTPLLKQDNIDSGHRDSGHRLIVGYSDNGGAGCVNDNPRGFGWDNGGFRLSVVFKKY